MLAKTRWKACAVSLFIDSLVAVPSDWNSAAYSEASGVPGAQVSIDWIGCLFQDNSSIQINFCEDYYFDVGCEYDTTVLSNWPGNNCVCSS